METFWIEVARQAPALAAFIIAVYFIVKEFIKAIREILTEQSKGTTQALTALTKQIGDMTEKLVSHDAATMQAIDDMRDRVNRRQRKQS